MKKSVGFNWGTSAVSTTYWTGFRLCDLLKHCGAKTPLDGAKYVHFKGVSKELPQVLGSSSRKPGAIVWESRPTVSFDPLSPEPHRYHDNVAWVRVTAGWCWSASTALSASPPLSTSSRGHLHSMGRILCTAFTMLLLCFPEHAQLASAGG